MDQRAPDSGLLQRLRDPVRARKPSSLVGLMLAVCSSFSFALLDGNQQSLALGICWLLMAPTALIRGWAAAFFLEHGVGLRRIVAECAGGVAVALVSCALLTSRGSGAVGLVYNLILSFALYGAVFLGLSAGAAFGIAFGTRYLSHRLHDVDDIDW